MRSLVLFKPDNDADSTATPSQDALAPLWRKITVFNPVVTLIGGFRSLFGSESSGAIGLAMIAAFVVLGLAAVWLVLKSGYRLKL